MGHAYTMTLCDILARYQRLENKEVYFLTGSDENTGKVVRAAKEANKSIEEFLTEINKNFENLYKSLNISYDQFIRTTDKEKHWPGAIALWNKLVEAGDIYKSIYRGLYCPSCEAFYTGKDLVDVFKVVVAVFHSKNPEIIKAVTGQGMAFGILGRINQNRDRLTLIIEAQLGKGF